MADVLRTTLLFHDGLLGYL